MPGIVFWVGPNLVAVFLLVVHIGKPKFIHILFDCPIAIVRIVYEKLGGIFGGEA